MKKSEIPGILAELETKFADLTDKSVAKFGLQPNDIAVVNGLHGHTLGEHFAASNIGFTNAEDLDGLAEEEFPEEEIKAWTRVMLRAAKLCTKMKLPLTNRNVILVSHHKQADREYSKG